MRKILLILLALAAPATTALARKTNQPIYEDPFDIGAGGASLTRASKDGMIFSNPALLPQGGKFFRWVGTTFTLLSNKESIDTAREIFGKAMPKVCDHRDDGLPLVTTNADGYVTTKEGGWHDTNAPDVKALYKMQACFSSWDKEAKRQGDYVNAIESGIRDLATK